MAKIKLKGGQFTRDRRLDRLVSFDERSRAFPIRTTIPPTAKPRSYAWSCGYWLDQGQDGACTGFSVTQEAGARPVIVAGLTNEIAQGLYQRAKQLDEWPGEDYEGSSVLAAMKAGQERGWYKAYRWAFGIDDLVMALGHAGPGVLGINWYDSMFEPDADGFLSVTGAVAGGHAILCNAVNVKSEYVTFHNSWGKGWSRNAEAKVRFKDLDRLLREDGEACIPTQRTKPVHDVVKLPA